MRQIKFRGKRIDNGEWVYGYYVFCEGNHQIYYTVIEAVYKNKPSLVSVQVDPSTIGQYTGLKDKNREEIFEGDILKSGHGNKWVVIWQSTSYRLKKIGRAFPTASLKPFTSEIIGNIHDNKQ